MIFDCSKNLSRRMNKRNFQFFNFSRSFASHFGYYDEDEQVVPVQARKIYRNDDIGLRTLDTENRLKIITYPHVNHFEWHMNVTVIQKAILAHLD